MSSAGRKRPRAAVHVNKYYVVLFNSVAVFYPIKANLPYGAKRGGKWVTVFPYCAGQPQFFGGREERGDGTMQAALSRETLEESVGTYGLFGPVVGAPVLEDSHIDENTGETADCSFFSTHRFIGGRGDWPSEQLWRQLSRKKREMCWVAAIKWTAFNATMTDIDIGMTLLTNALSNNNAPAGFASAPTWAKALMATDLSQQYKDSFTCRAFGKFVRDRLRLPSPPRPPQTPP